MSSQLFYRAYSPKSAGDLVSGKAKQGWHRPSHINLEQEFRNHRHLSNREPTGLVSVTTSIIRALKTAFNKHYRDGENPAEIWIAFIEVPDRELDVCHSAQEIARRRHDQDSVLFKDEYLFEWEILREYVVHGGSVQTLIDRGLNMKEYLEDTRIEHQHHTTTDFESTGRDRKNHHVYYSHARFESHKKLAVMAQAFGAKALRFNIPWKIFADCCTDSFSWPPDFEQRYDVMQKDCNEWLLDWWLFDDGFNFDQECHSEYASHLQGTMTARRDEFSRHAIEISDDPTRFEEEFEIMKDMGKRWERRLR
ncbi:hypothetical protein BOTNAR_0200g00020 [Botryotinia narcissicola]|uniref:DUF7587 domain-containing protein n=1 Tax=Botryotinia narcissicola TaxID=278944 RepID=A0A4Z1I9Z9_9HELO|nr:hypothetical protein BOTNAR_0200g00020 [Botryotinia narcissicola]